MILIDTSCWIEVLRERGDAEVRRRLHAHLHGGRACWMPVVRLELWNGARGERERKILREFEAALPELDMPAAVWDLACDLARRARAAGLTLPISDLLIAACARHHGIEVDSLDAHFAALTNL